MKVAIVGGGFTGLSSAVTLLDSGHSITIFESGSSLGGLASGFKIKGATWSLERYYHHIFDNDTDIKNLANKIGHSAQMYSPITKVFLGGHTYQLDSPLSVLLFPKLPLLSRLHLGFGLAFLKFFPFGRFLEGFTATSILPLIVGKKGYAIIWEPLLKAKFGPYVDEVNLAWFWARVYKRTPKLGYFSGGFEELANKIGEYIKKHSGIIHLNSTIDKIEVLEAGSKFKIKDKVYDRVIITIPAPLASKLFTKRITNMPAINYLWGQTLILELYHSFQDSYWLNILDQKFPFLVSVQHTHLINKSHYGNNHLLYLGNYLPDGDKRLKLTDRQLLDLYLPFLKKINKNFDSSWIKSYHRFGAPFAQPVFPVNYSQLIPQMTTSIPGVYLANMSMVYPWDRGTNYAVKLGVDVAKLVGNF